MFFLIIAVVPLVLIMGLFIEDEYSVTKTVTIERPSDEVFDYVKNLKNQSEYSVWEKMDPDMKKTYKGNDGEVGFISKWDSDNEDVGKGEQEILKIVDGERIDFKLRFKEPFEANSDVFITTESLGPNTTKVTWSFKGQMAYPMNIMLLFMDMEGEIGPDLQNGLNNLKKVLESPE
ncbi:MAG: SRPBCC family protein [Crocinitomicaceae bacterium]|nr:SRPBCC family protein [Crocinitomicaceae bacterium]